MELKVMTRKQSFENVNVLNAVKLRHSSENPRVLNEVKAERLHSTHFTRKQSFDAKPPTCVELRERLHSTQVSTHFTHMLRSTQVSTVMTRKQSFENVNVLNAVKLRHSSENPRVLNEVKAKALHRERLHSTVMTRR